MNISKALLLTVTLISFQFLSVANAGDSRVFKTKNFESPNAGDPVQKFAEPPRYIKSLRSDFQFFCTPQQEAELANRAKSKKSQKGEDPCLVTQKEADEIKKQYEADKEKQLPTYPEAAEAPKKDMTAFRDKLMEAIVATELDASKEFDSLKKASKDGKIPAYLTRLMVSRIKNTFSMESFHKPMFLVGTPFRAFNPEFLAESGGAFDKKSVQKASDEATASAAPSSAQK